MDQETKPVRVKVARLDDEYLANLRKMSTGNVLERKCISLRGLL